MRSLHRTVAVSTVVVALAATLAACGSSSGSSSTGGGSGTVTLHIESWKGGGAEPANVAKINAAFEKAHPDIKLDFTYVPPNDVYQQKLQSQLLAGTAADVIMVDPQKVQTWGKSGYLADLSSEPWASNISDVVKPFVSESDKIMASPMELSPVGLYVNLDILHQAGIDQPPTDFPMFLDDLGKLKSAGLPGLAFPDAQGYMAEFSMLMSAATTVYQTTPDWDQQFMDGKVSFTDAFQTPLNQIKQLGDAGYVDFKNAVGTDETTTGQPDFIAGKAAFYAGGSWLGAAIEKAGFKLGFIPWPGGDAGTTPSALVFPGTMWAVNAKSKEAAAARTYVDYWTDPKNLAPFLSAEAAISPYPGDSGQSDPLLATMSTAYGAGKYAMFPTNTWDLADPETQIRTILQGFLLGKTDVAGTLSAIQSAAAKARS